MVVTYYIKVFRTGVDRHKSILMSLLLLVAEITIKNLNHILAAHTVYYKIFPFLRIWSTNVLQMISLLQIIFIVTFLSELSFSLFKGALMQN